MPANTTATVDLPTSNPKSVRESGVPLEKAKGVTGVTESTEGVVCELAAGEYNFQMDIADHP